MRNATNDDSMDAARLYRARFTADDLAFKQQMWQVLTERFFQRYVEPDDTVLDLGAGACEFLNEIRCARKIAVDLNPDTAAAARDAIVLNLPGSAMTPVETASVDVVFCSNFFEHLESKQELLKTLDECHRVLRLGGSIVILQPNIRYLGGKYWDYLDHHIPLTHLSMGEALRLSGFTTTEVVPRFLPYTVRSRLPKSPGLVRIYLKVRPIWPIFGRQMLIVARREAA
jgi:SAM-dependent methyltransferase